MRHRSAAALFLPSASWLASSAALYTGTSFTRATTATYFDAAGVLQTASSGAPRFAYTAGVLDGYLQEGLMTNLCLRARAFNNATWIKVSTTAVTDKVGLDGVANSAGTITATAGNGTILQTVTQAAVQCTFSCYLKRSVGTGVINITQDGTTWTACPALNASTWTRVSLTATVLNPVFGFQIVTSGDAIIADYAQLETGEIATSPVSTAGSTTTRNADVATLALTVSNTAGSLYVSFVPYYQTQSSTIRQIANVSNTALSNRASMSIGTATALPTGNISSGSVSQLGAAVGSGAIAVNATSKMIITWSAANMSAVCNGGTAAVGAGVTPPTGMNSLKLGVTETALFTQPLMGCIKEWRLYGYALSQAQMQALTA